MKLNMSILDRLVRLIVALVVGFLYVAGIISGTLGMVLFGIAVVFLLTSLLGVCPLYSLFGFSTCDNKRD
jgi:hypothetical protein